MYTSQDLAIRIKAIAKEKNTVIKDMLAELSLGSNTMSALYHGKSIAFDSLAKIADYLDCSVDYLLGRTDNPNITADTYINGDNNGIQAVNNGNNSNLTVNGTPKTDTEELVEMIQGLPLVQRAKIITQIDEMKNKK